MPRIRTIKPEFFSSESMAQCGPWARLLAIALMQRADSEGRMRWIPIQVQADAFPFDEDVDVESMAQELEAVGYLVRYTVEGKKYATIPGFTEHQRLSGKEAAAESKFPPLPCEAPGEEPGKRRGSVELFLGKHPDAQEQGTGKGNREQGGGNASANPSGPPPCPQAEILDLYHEILPELRRHRTWDGARADNLRARWRSDPKRQSLDYWRKFFEHIRKSPFLMGDVEPTQGRTRFQADLEWLVQKTKFAQVIDGKFHDRDARGAA